VREEGEAATRCVNSSCPAILRGALRHWVSKAALDVDGLGGKLIEQLVDQGLVTSIARSLPPRCRPARQPGADGRDLSLEAGGGP